MKKHLPLAKPTTLKLRREVIRALEGRELQQAAAGVSGSGMPIGRHCGPSVDTVDFTCAC